VTDIGSCITGVYGGVIYQNYRRSLHFVFILHAMDSHIEPVYFITLIRNCNYIAVLFQHNFLVVLTLLRLSHWSCHSKEPTTALRPTKEPWLGANIVIFLLGISRPVLCEVVSDKQAKRRSVVEELTSPGNQ
jgi:hypothetical protein